MCNVVYSKSVDHYQTRMLSLSTCAIKHCKQNWRDPGGVTVANTKLANQFLEEDADGLGEGVGKAGDDEAAGQHCPTPTTVWRLHTRRRVVHHRSSHDALWQLVLSSVAVNAVVKRHRFTSESHFSYYIWESFQTIVPSWSTCCLLEFKNQESNQTCV